MIWSFWRAGFRQFDEARIRQLHLDAGDETLLTLAPSFALAHFIRRVLAEWKVVSETINSEVCE